MKRAKPTDPAIGGCLKRIQGGDLNAVGVLADYLEEYGLPFARRVRAAWKYYSRRREYFGRRDWSRTEWTCRSALEWLSEYLRLQIGRMFKMGWRAKKPRRAHRGQSRQRRASV